MDGMEDKEAMKEGVLWALNALNKSWASTRQGVRRMSKSGGRREEKKKKRDGWMHTRCCVLDGLGWDAQLPYMNTHEQTLCITTKITNARLWVM